jgi:hypothetical protein
MMFVASISWTILCIIAVLLSVIAYQEPHFYLTNRILSKAFLFWIASMIVLDIGVILIGVIVGYNPPSIACAMLLLIQGIYFLSGVSFYIKSKVEGNNFNAISAKKRIRFVAHQAVALATFMLGISFGIKPGIVMFLPAFALVGLMLLLDKVFTKLLR